MCYKIVLVTLQIFRESMHNIIGFFLYMYTLHCQKQRQKTRYIKGAWDYKIKNINYLSRNKSKNYIGFIIDKRK